MTKEQFDEICKILNGSITSKDKTTIIVFIILIVGFLLFSIITNLIIPLVLNNNTRKNDIQKIKIERRLDFIEQLLKGLKILNSSLCILDKENINKSNELISEIRESLFVDSYKVPDKMKKDMETLLDYFQSVLLDSHKRNTETEKQFFNKIYKEFDAIR